MFIRIHEINNQSDMKKFSVSIKDAIKISNPINHNSEMWWY